MSKGFSSLEKNSPHRAAAARATPSASLFLSLAACEFADKASTRAGGKNVEKISIYTHIYTKREREKNVRVSRRARDIEVHTRVYRGRLRGEKRKKKISSARRRKEKPVFLARPLSPRVHVPLGCSCSCESSL